MTGVLALVNRGDLAGVELHGRPLWRHALDALVAAVLEPPMVVAEEAVVRRLAGRAGVPEAVRWLPVDSWWDALGGEPQALLVHDPLCPLTTPSFLVEVAEAGEKGSSAAAYRPVTDTVKTVDAGRISGTVDREQLAAIGSPVYLGRSVVDTALASREAPPLTDLAGLVTWARARGEVTLVRAPSLARRVDDVSAVGLLECVDQLGHRLRQ